MEVLTIEHSAFQQLVNKIDAMDEFIRKAKLEQKTKRTGLIGQKQSKRAAFSFDTKTCPKRPHAPPLPGAGGVNIVREKCLRTCPRESFRTRTVEAL